MRRPQNLRVKSQSGKLPSDHSKDRSEGNSNTRDLIRWLIIIPIIWILIFGCGALSIVGAAPPTPLDLLSKNHADYSPWQYVSLQPFREGFLEDIKNDFINLEEAVSIFAPPKIVGDPFIKPTESSIQISVQVTATSTHSSQIPATSTTTGELGSDPTHSPTATATEDPNASPTVSLTPSRTSAAGSTSTPARTNTAGPTPTPSSTPPPSATSTLTSTPSLTPTQTLEATLTPSVTPSTVPTQSVNVCSTYEYFHAHSPYSSGNVIGFIVHAMPVSGPATSVVVTGVTVNQDAGNPSILTVNKINWYHTGMGSTSVNVGQQAESVHVSTNLSFYACYPAGTCDHSYYGGFIEAEFDGTPSGSYNLSISVSFPAYGKSCSASKGISN